MADRGSWRRHPNEGGGSPLVGEVIGGRANASLPVRPPDYDAHLAAARVPRAVGAEGSGPAAPLKPLYITAGRPLPHPAAYAGPDNWAFTPNDTLPSLPATPSRAMHALGWQRASTPSSSDAHTAATPARDNAVTAKSVLNKRLEEHRNYSPSPVRNQRQSPKPGSASLGTGAAMSTVTRPFSTPDSVQVTSATPPSSIAAVLSSANTNTDSPPSLRHRESVTSLASSTQYSLGQHHLSHSRRPSQSFVQSPALSSVSGISNSRNAPGYRVYRPPHLRTESYYGLQPRIAHYDRVSAPSLRGQSRSPSVSRSRDGSSGASRTPSEGFGASSGMGNRRLSNLGAHNTVLEHNGTFDGQSTLDSSSLIAKLANAKLDLRSRADRSSPRGDPFEDDGQRSQSVEDVDLSVEDMMMSSTLTDQYCRSRSASVSGSTPFIDIFEVGDRLGPGMMHDGLEITIAKTTEGFNDQTADWTGTQLEVVSKLGEGSYAVVYLVKEVDRREHDNRESDHLAPTTITGSPHGQRDVSDQDEADETVLQDDDAYSTTIKAGASGRLADEVKPKSLHTSKQGERYFALKCLCKRDLSDEMLEVQRLEATIHQSIPPHPNIVTLYRTYETSEWLFLILEYCPGQDLFYWLEQAQDTENLGAATPGADSSTSITDESTAIDATPPSPSLLASTETQYLLSKRRLRLISRMFQQICEAVGFCHSRGISHRDIKPENFIVEDTRASGDETAGGGIKVKLTDFGLAVAQTRCIDFDCGSKPYMSYECRNNTSRWYNPIESDIWSLGIVLLNLIFHRNPFMEPSVEHCPSFASYVEDPVRFLTTAFRGLKREAAQFLAENVFCDVTEGDEGGQRHRVSARELGEWASSLAEHLEVPGTSDDAFLSPPQTSVAGPDLGITSPLWHSRSPASSIVNSLMASPASNARSINIHQELTNMGISEEEIENFTPLFYDSMTAPEAAASGVEVDAGMQQPSDVRPRLSDTSESTSLRQTLNTQKSTAINSLTAIAAPKEPQPPELSQTLTEEDVSSTVHPSADEDRRSRGRQDSAEERQHLGERKDVVLGSNGTLLTDGDDDVHGNRDGVATGDVDDDSLFAPPSATSTSANPKRRKRGARRGRTLAKQQLKRSRSVENMQANEGKPHSTSDSARDQTIRELAEASQTLAREMSKAMQLRAGTERVAQGPQVKTADPLSLEDGAMSETNGSRAIASNRAISQHSRNSSQEGLRSATIHNALSARSAEEGTGAFGKKDWTAVPQNTASSTSMNKPVLQDSGRGRPMHPSSTAADWRERNTSSTSIASVSSINTVSSFSSEVGSIRSTASAPPALITQHRSRGPPSLTSGHSSTTSSRASGLSSLRPSGGSALTRGMLAAGSNLGTINERGTAASSRGGQKDLDASYLAEIFGGRASHQVTRDRARQQATNGQAHRQGSSHSSATSGIKGGVLDTASQISSAERSPAARRLPALSSNLPFEGSNTVDRNGNGELKHQALSHPPDVGAAVSSAPRKKMLGKFLQNVKSYNKGVKAAPSTYDEADANGNEIGPHSK